MVPNSLQRLAVAMCFIPCLLVAQSSGWAASQNIPAEPLEALVAFIQEVHPNAYRFISKAELDAHLKAEIQDLGGDRDPITLARAASRILAVIGDAHLAVGIAPDVTTGPLVPFLLKRAGERIFLDASEPAMPIGTEVISVDGRPAGELLASMARLASVDGARPTVMAAEAERRFPFLALLELGAKDAYELRVRRPGAMPETVTLQATNREGVARLTAARHSAPVWGAMPESGEPAWPTLEPIDVDTNLLRLASFGLLDESGYEERITALFAMLEPESRLVVDLRGNEGGNRALGIIVLKRLLGRPFTQWTSVATRVKRIPNAFRESVSFPLAPASALYDFPGTRQGQRWVVDGDPLAERMVPLDELHQGPIAVLVDDATNSAAMEFLVGLLAHREGVQVIGTETQGACDRHTGQLPVVFNADGLAAIISLFEIDMVTVAHCQPGGVIVPDMEIDYTEEDFLRGRDPYMDALDSERILGETEAAQLHRLM